MGTYLLVRKLRFLILFFFAFSFLSKAQNNVGLISPSNNIVIIDTTLQFHWNPILAGSSYQFQFSQDPLFSTVLLDSTGTIQTTRSASGLLPGTYYWRVRAYVNAVPAVWSEVRSFKVISLKAINSLKLWWDAADSVDTDSVGHVVRWGDKSGTGHYGAQVSAQCRPGKTDSVLNNKPVITFDGKLQAIWTNPFTLSQPNTMFMIFDKKNNTYNNFMTDGGNINEFRLGMVGGNQYVFYGGNFFNIGDAGPNGYKMFTLRGYGPKSYCRNNFALLGTGDIGPNNLSGFTLGTYGIHTLDVDVHAELDVAEILLFNDTIPLAQTIDIENYLRYKYAPAVSLGKDIINSTSFCPITLSPQSNYLTYLWNTGATTKTISAAAPGTYWVKVTDRFGFISADTMDILSYPQINTIQDSLIICEGSSLQWSTNLNKKDFTFLWQDGTTDSILTITKGGTYSVTVFDKFGCNLKSKSITVLLDTYPSLVSLGNDTTVCAGNIISLTAGAAQTVSYLWSDNSTGTSLAINTTGQYWVTTKSARCTATDTINVVVAGKAPTADFIFTPTCFGNITNFTDASIPPVGENIVTWSWLFGDASGSPLTNVSHTYADTGKYVVKHTVITAAGCAATSTKTVHVYPQPKLDYTYTLSCEDIAIQFSGAVISYGYPISKWSWNFGEPGNPVNTSLLQKPSHYYSTPGSYDVQLIATNTQGCSDTVIKTIVVKPAPAADFTNTAACKYSDVMFTDKTVMPAGVTIQTTFWNFGDNVTSVLLNPSHAYLANVSFNVLHIITGSNGCKDSVTKTLSVSSKPTAYFSQSKICEDTITNFTDISVVSGGTIAKWKWTFGGVDIATVKNPQYVFANPGNVKVSLLVTTDKNCSDSIQKTLVVNQKPVANFTYTPTYGNPKLSVSFTNTSVGNGLTYFWNFNDGGTSTLVNPVHIYGDTGIYKPVLLAKNAVGCSDTASGVITVLPRHMDVAIGDIVATLQNGFLNLTAQITNKGTADILTMDVYIKINGGASIRESWTGRLVKGATIVNTFKTSIQMEKLNHFICINLTNPNGFADEYPTDNERCEALDASTFEVLELYPNPTAGLVTIPVVAPEAGNMDITLYDVEGHFIHTVYSGVVIKGLQLFSLETADLNSGLYTCKIEYGDYIIVRKIIKK